MSLRSHTGFGLLCLVITAPAAAQNIDRVRELYVAAAYEEALAAMPTVASEPARTDVEQYRALCLLALGREAEAVEAVERLVRDHPTYLPPEGETSPRMQAIFAAARAKLVPDIARQTYVDGKAAYEARDHDVARTTFQRTLDLMDSLPDTARTGLADLRLLAAEFLELSTLRPVVAADAAPPPVANREVPEPAALEYAAPVAIQEAMPRWIPPDRTAMRTEYVGMLRVHIGRDGRVQSATILKSSHPVYDSAVLRAAPGWTYRPATRGGQPVVAQKDVQIRLVPR
ncbi:MAG TPA: TonB family protein [Vicinamibacterales bacterium]|nr:TonB family protein [Vicinamibacterales bacterium]